MAVPGTPHWITVMSVLRSNWLRRRLAAPPGDCPCPAPSPAQPWQYWQSAFSRNTRRPWEKSCAEALDDAAMIATHAQRTHVTRAVSMFDWSCPALRRAPTALRPSKRKDVDRRDKPGHDVDRASIIANIALNSISRSRRPPSYRAR